MAIATLIRVGLCDDAATVSMGTAGDAWLLAAGDQKVALTAHQPYQVRWDADGQLSLVTNDGSSERLPSPVRLVTTGPIFVAKRWYRGSLELLATAGGITAINEVPLEEYLLGVVPVEMPPSWPSEALKAQAVAARTYAMAHLGDFKASGYDLKPTVKSQVYGGLTAENASATLAVTATVGKILTYDGKPIQAYYCAGAGGYTEGAEAITGFEQRTASLRPGSYPYLQPVPDFDWAAPRWRWEVFLTSEQIAQKLERQGLELGRITRITATERSYSQRVRWIKVTGDKGEREMPGQTFRFALGLYSTLFSIEAVPNRGFHFVGRGWGHGVGLSQWGAKQLANWGYDYQEILVHYYPGAELTNH
ncbi:MAG: SpoIID/LytB domain-containing protein [Cyanobacteria bacterium NC_groundwater_1444_Ag_S-0.65um_54_12]|nr:SpoIID/LytB domain-containing protein [Cyanobacteria bacterium NC_groundwater_1444_Ag_S-0.65um_54_12]